MTAVARDQFAVSGIFVRHLPTGARFTNGSDFVNWGRVGDRLPNGDEYTREDVMHVLLQILREIARELPETAA